MANKEQLNILKQGIEAWNQWREEHPDEIINLRGANLKGRNLSGANFRNADIRGATFRNARLVKADFTQARAGNTFLGSCAQFLLSLILGGLIGWLLYLPALFYLSIAELFSLLHKPLKPPPFFHLYVIGLALLLTGGCLLAIRKGKARVAAAVAAVAAVVMTTVIAVTLSGAVAVSAIVVEVLTVVVVAVGAVVVAGTGIRIVTAAATVAVAAAAVAVGAGVGTGMMTGTVAIALLVIIVYIGWRARREDPQFAILRRIGLALASVFSTNFRETDLTGATFNAAHLKYTRFVKATLNGVSWQQAQQLQFARFSGTILADRDVRESLVHGNGQG